MILNTPTGSGKSLVATAAHFAGLATGRRSVYTAPIKALVSEKFFALCREFDSSQVGMVTGDGSINPDAPIICCTAEILANWALRDGAEADVDIVIMDEFHFYADPQRGWAWQVPLLELNRCQFLLLSATLGPTDFFERELERRTGRPTVLVASADRPVPLDFEYRRTTLHASVEELLASGRTPIYLVHFTQREATEAAQGYLSLDPLSKSEKEEVKQALQGFRFDSPIGKDLRRFLLGGVGVHHAGLLPKYRLLVERLAQRGLLAIICGTDTLGVGVNVPIRSVLFTQLHKFDGTDVRVLRRREFKQIAGRAGRKGFDDAGTVWVQAPSHVVENLTAEAKAKASSKKKKVVKKKPPDRGYAHWTEDTFNKLVSGDAEPLVSSFDVSHQMVMSLLDRPGDGCAAVRRLLTTNHEPKKRRRAHIRRAIAVYRSLADAEVLEFLDEPDELGRLVRVNFDLQDEFALHQPLSLWAIEALAELDDQRDEPGHALDVLTILEAVLDNPAVIIAAQVNKAKDALMAEMKADGVEYEERLERLALVEAPKPNKEWIYESFDRFRAQHPWVGGDNVRPKSIARDLWERGMTFTEFINYYGLKRSEGVVLRYLSDVYKALRQNVPADSVTDELEDLTAWLGAVVRQVDSSLIDEWDRLQRGAEDPSAEPADRSDEIRPPSGDATTITSDERAWRVMVRNEAFRLVELLARSADHTATGLASLAEDTDDLDLAIEDYFGEYDAVITDADARAARNVDFDPDPSGAGQVTQTISDPEEHYEWVLQADVDVESSNEQGRAVLHRVRLVRL